MSARLIWLILIFCVIFGSVSVIAQTVELQSSWLEEDAHRVRFGATMASGAVGFSGSTMALLSVGEDSISTVEIKQVVCKSPIKAFLLSAVLPGAGQFYLGNRLKALVFLGVEATAWGFEAKLRGQGDTRTDEFEQFNRDHWIQSNYEDYLAWNYGGIRDDELIHVTEISHHLPKTRTQQYYEMTGKYNQFSWGWDDANYDGNYLENYDAINPPPTITNEVFAPVSVRRVAYEGMRHDANEKYDQARKMVAVAIVNHLVSGFEALFAANRYNKQVASNDTEFARLDFQASLKSYSANRDTPFVQLSYKF